MRRFLLAACLSTMLLSCVDDRTGTGCESNFTVSYEDETGSKSSLTESAFRIHDINVFVYDRSGRLVGTAYSFSGGDVTFIFPDADASYDLFFLVNAGKPGAPSREDELKSLALDLSDLSGCGIPMAGVLSAYKPVETNSVKVKMLCSQLELTLEHSAVKADYSVKSVRLRNCARTVLPFSDASSADETVSFGDSLSAEEIRQLVGGGTVYLYAPENMQGVLLPFNDDPFQKIPANLPSAELSSKCTYLEAVADVRTTTSLFYDVHFRTFVGADITSDFNLKRSRKYRYELNFESNMIREEEWRIDPSDPVVSGVLKVSKTEARIMKGITDTVYVYMESVNGREMELEISVDGSRSDNADLTMKVKDMELGGKPVKALIFSTVCPIDGFNPYDEEPDYKLFKVRINSRESFGGTPMICSDIDVKVFHEVFPICLRTKTIGTTCRMYAFSNNPLGIRFSGNILCREGQNLSGRGNEFRSIRPDRAGALMGEVFCYDAGTAIFVGMRPLVSGEAKDMYMGEFSREYFGPGTDHAPAKMAQYTSDGWYEMDDYVTADPSGRDYCARLSCSNGYLFRLDSLTTGWNSWDRYCLEEYAGRPFYFVNGGLELIFTGKMEDTPKYLDDSGRVGYMVYAYEPGRDLGLESRYDSRGSCVFGTQLGTMKQFWGNVHTWMEWRGYDYRIYLSINGCSCWAGATKGSSGYIEYK